MRHRRPSLPYRLKGKRVWVPYQDLTAAQQHQLTQVLKDIGRTLGVTAVSLCEGPVAGAQPSSVA